MTINSIEISSHSFIKMWILTILYVIFKYSWVYQPASQPTCQPYDYFTSAIHFYFIFIFIFYRLSELTCDVHCLFLFIVARCVFCRVSLLLSFNYSALFTLVITNFGCFPPSVNTKSFNLKLELRLFVGKSQFLRCKNTNTFHFLCWY